MSFTAKVKEEIIKKSGHKRGCCNYAELAGILAYSAIFKENSDRFILQIAFENTTVAMRCFNLIHKLFGDIATIQKKQYSQKHIIYKINVADTRQLLQNVGLTDVDGIAFHVSPDITNQECCRRAFIRGAFLGGGTIADPEKRYHLEFVTTHFMISEDMKQILDTFSIHGKNVTRQSKYVTYLKDSEIICDILTMMGAHSCVMEIYNTKIYKEIKNQANRVTNFESANITKVVDASIKQVDAIRLIEKYRGLESLGPQLEETARLRIQNPDISMIELGKLLQPPIGKSGVNHRMRKLIEIADKLRGEYHA